MATLEPSDSAPRPTGGRDLVTADRMVSALPAPVNPYLQQFGFPPPEPPAQSISIPGMINAGWLFARRQWWLIGLGLMAGCALAPLGFAVAPPSYQAIATIMLLGGRSQAAAPGADADVPLDNSAALESQLEIMRSDRIGRAVLEDLKLREDPEFKVASEGRIATWLGPDIAEMLGRSPIRTPDRIERFQLDILAKMVTVRRIPGTFAVEVVGNSASAIRAAQVANAVAEAYLADQIESKQGQSHTTNTWLTTQLGEVRDQLEAAKQAVIAFRFANNLDASAAGQASDKRLAELSTQLADVRAKAQENEIRLARVEKVIADYPTAAIKPVLPDQASNPVIQKLRDRSYELNQRLSEWTQRFGANHEATQKVRKEIADLDAALLDEYSRLAAAYRGDLEIAKVSEASISTAIKSASETHRVDETALIKLRELEGAVVSKQASYDSILSRQAASAEMERFPISRSNIINRALEPNGKNLKKTLQASGILFLVGLGGALGIALLREMLNGTFRRIAEVEEAFGGKPVCGFAAPPQPAAKLDWQRIGKRSKLLNTARVIVRDVGPQWSCETDPRGAYATAIRSLRQQFSQPAGLEAKRGVSVGVVSTELGQGASTTAAALAISAAAAGSRVLLVDSDFGHRSLSTRMAPSAAAGLFEAIANNQPVEEMLWTDPATGLAFLPAGTPEGAAVSELLTTEGFAALAAKLREVYDVVVFDLPMLEAAIPSPFAAGAIGSYIAVVKWARSKRADTKAVFDAARGLRDQVDAVAFNLVDMRRFRLFDQNSSVLADDKRLRPQAI